MYKENKVVKIYSIIILVLISLTGCNSVIDSPTNTINYSDEMGSLQQVINAAPAGSTVVCDPARQLILAEALTIDKAITLKGLNARLPEGLPMSSLILVNALSVALVDLDLHGNYDSVSQKDRAPLIRIHAGGFLVERCKFYDSTKDGVEVTPLSGSEDIVGGTIRDIEAFRIGRDAVSISGGFEGLTGGLKVRNITVENVSLKKGYLRGAVEVSDGTDNITVRNVTAEDCPYAVDVQDHRRQCAANTNITIENVTAINCRHIIRTANSDRGHSKLNLRNFTAINCQQPVYITNTKDVTIDGLKIIDHSSKEYPPVIFKNCRGISLKNETIESEHFADDPIHTIDCTDINF